MKTETIQSASGTLAKSFPQQKLAPVYCILLLLLLHMLHYSVPHRSLKHIYLALHYGVYTQCLG